MSNPSRKTYPSRLRRETPPPQTPPPRTQRTSVTSPIVSDDFSDIPPYVPTTRTRVGQIRGRDGVEELAQIVGSAKFRNIKRSANFMPGQFYIWNDAENGGNKKYWGGYQDVDDDGLAHEFVVRRGGSTIGQHVEHSSKCTQIVMIEKVRLLGLTC